MLNKDDILNKTNKGLAVFQFYIPGQWRVGRNFLNPLYLDRKASCNIYLDKRSGNYKIKDFGNDEFSGDCFNLVAKIKSLDCSNSQDFVEILQTINYDLQLNLENELAKNNSANQIKTPNNKPKESAIAQSRPYSFIKKSISQKELFIYESCGITQTVLQQYNCVSLQEFLSENAESKPYKFISTVQEPMFGYIGQRHIKIYRPYSEIRFAYGGNFGESYCFGLEQLPPKGDTLFITGGEKDVLTLASHGFHAICFNSETSHIPKKLIRKLSYRFKHIVLLYDCDKTGLEASLRHQQELAEFDVKRLVLQLIGTKQEKDISDYFKMGNTNENFNILFLDFLDSLYSETMAILKPCEVDLSNPPKSESAIISINDVPIGTPGNLLGITGGEGTGKSNYVGSIISGTIRPNDTSIDTLGMQVGCNGSNKAILLYDTEQSESQLYKNVASILKRSHQEVKPGCFKAFCLTGMARKERMQAIVHSMDKFYYQFGGIHIVVIDGIADLVRCANDEAESVGIIDELYRLAGIYKTCIVCVLHFVPNGLKLRGHLGSELQRKAAAILSIERDSDPQLSVVKALKVREGSPLDVPLVQFSWDKDVGMHVYAGAKSKEEKDKRKEIELINIARTIFSECPQYLYTELTNKLQSALDIKERTAKSYIRFLRDKKIIHKSPVNEGYFILGQI